MISLNNLLGTKMYSSIFEIPIDGEKISSQKNNDEIIDDDCEYLGREETDINTSKGSFSNYNMDLFSEDDQSFIQYKKETDNTSNFNEDENNKNKEEIIIYSNVEHSLSQHYANSNKVYMAEFFKPGWKIKAKKSVIKFKKLMSKIVKKID